MLGVYAGLHNPPSVALNLAGYTSPLTAKVWTTTLVLAFAVVQVVSARMMYRMQSPPWWTPVVHRWSGRAAFLLAIPVAAHCLYLFGLQAYSPRVLIHSLLGLFFFGAFTVKMLALSQKGIPDRLLPWVGGLVFTLLAGLWLTSSLWFFTTIGVLYY